MSEGGQDGWHHFAADKLSKVREMRIQVACDAHAMSDTDVGVKLEHYVESRSMLEEQLGDVPLVQALEFEVEALLSLPPARG